MVRHQQSPSFLIRLQSLCDNSSYPEWQAWLRRNHPDAGPAGFTTLPPDSSDPIPVARPRLTLSADIAVRFGTFMVLQPEDSFPRFPGLASDGAPVRFQVPRFHVLCPDYATPQRKQAQRRRRARGVS